MDSIVFTMYIVFTRVCGGDRTVGCPVTPGPPQGLAHVQRLINDPIHVFVVVRNAQLTR